MKLDILGQPEAGAIGGVPDLAAAIANVGRVSVPAYVASIFDGQTSPEQGSDYSAAEVAQLETLTADKPADNFIKNLPILGVAAVVVILWAIFRRAK